MKYTPPIGGAANDPYVDANPATGVEGSPVPAAAIEHPQREIANVITSAGLTPDVGDLNQLYQAIQRIAVGGDYKQSVRVASTAPIDLAAPGANIDNVVMVVGDSFLEKDHAMASSRGIYIWNGAAVPATRRADADIGAELNSGALVPVEEGTVNADTVWMLTTDGAITIGTTALVFQWSAGLNAPTQAQFDTSTKIANMAAVQRALGNAQGALVISEATTLAASDAGKEIVLSGGTIFVVTLPLCSTVPKGAAFSFCHVGSGGNRTVSTQGADIFDIGGNTISSIILGTGDNLVVVNNGSYWNVLGGSSHLQFSAVFLASRSANGYQKFPGGLILQWGSFTASATVGNPVAITFPVAFPNAVVDVSPSAINASTANSATWFDSPTTTGFNARCAVASLSGRWFAIGY